MVISDAISDIGVISDSTVQQTLLELAADRELGVQAVAARAMAQWRSAGRDKQLFNTLNEWQLQTWLDLIAEILDQNNSREKDEHGDGPRDYIRATIALTIGYAAIYDPPNMLSNDICDLLKDLAEDQSPMVRNRFCWHTLPYVVPLHAMQLRDILHNMAQYIDLIPAIGRSLALAYQDNDKDVLWILDEWYRECKENRPKRLDPEEITLRETLLATIAMTLGYIQYDELKDTNATDEASKRIQNILSEENHPFVRKYSLYAISFLARYFKEVEPMLQRLVGELSENERVEVVEILTKIYLDQRRDLDKGDNKGDNSIKIDDEEYAIWVDSDRPITEIEEAMYRWIGDSKNPAAQQVATRAFVSFANSIDQREAQKISEIRELRKQPAPQIEQQPDTSAIIAPIKRFRESKFVENIIVWIATLSSKHYDIVIRGLLPEVLAQKEIDKQAMAFVLDKWRKDKKIKKIAELLDRAIWLVDNSKIIVLLIIAALIILAIII